MRSTEVVFFCLLYLLFFFMIGSLAGVTTFPPPAQWVGFEIWDYSIGIHLAFWDIVATISVIISVLGLTMLAGIKVFGSGVYFDQAFVVTLSIALFIGSLLAWTMTAMLTGVPIYVSAVLVWPFIGILIYGIISTARGGGG